MTITAITYLFSPHTLGIKCNDCDTCYHIQRKGTGNPGQRIRASARAAGWLVTNDEAYCKNHQELEE